jgi:uncharacterized protein YndB with AHSA1/START domain
MASTTTAATVSRSIEISAPASRVYDLVSDLPRMGEWSPECYRCDWRDGATEAAVGARFTGRNRRGLARWSTTGEVVAADRDRQIAFDVSFLGMPVARWRYEVEPVDSNRVRLTETWEDRRRAPMHLLGALGTGVRDREAHNAAGMEATLQRLKDAAEAGS